MLNWLFGRKTTSESEEKMSAKVAVTEVPAQPALAQHDSSVLDLAFAMDCTGSMSSYIYQAQQNIRQIVEEIVSKEKSDVHLALVEYRDHPPQDISFITRVLDFTPSVSKMKKRLDECSAAGGGDGPEAVADALQQVLKLSWREEATKICVFISDAPPHGLDSSGDGFPNGCPLGIDPMEVVRQMAEKNITIYLVGCEPSIIPYKDFFQAIAHITSGQYVPLNNASLLAKVVIGGAQEEISLQRLVNDVNAEVMQEAQRVQAMGGTVDEEELTRNIHSKLKSRGVKSKQLKMNSATLPEASATAKEYAALPSMHAVQSMYMKASPMRPQAAMMCPMGGGFSRSAMPSSSMTFGDLCMESAVPMCAPSATNAMNMMDNVADDYEVEACEEIHMQQAQRLVNRAMYKNKLK